MNTADLLRRRLEDFKAGTVARSGRHSERVECEVIQKTLNVVLAELDMAQQRANDPLIIANAAWAMDQAVERLDWSREPEFWNIFTSALRSLRGLTSSHAEAQAGEAATECTTKANTESDSSSPAATSQEKP